MLGLLACALRLSTCAKEVEVNSIISANNGNKRRNLMRYKILNRRSLPKFNVPNVHSMLYNYKDFE